MNRCFPLLFTEVPHVDARWGDDPRDLRDRDGSPADVRSGDLRHLREQGLIETARVPRYRDDAVALTKAGHGLLERHRHPDPERRQTFHSGLVRSRALVDGA